MPVAGLEGGLDGCLGLVVGDLEDAEAEDGHLDAVVEGDGLDVGGVEGGCSWLYGTGSTRVSGSPRL